MYNYFQLHPSKNFWRPLLQTMSLPRPSVTMEEEERMLGGDGHKVLIGLFIGWRYDQYSDWRYREKRQHSSGGCCVLHGATGFPCCRPQGAGHNLKQVLLFVVYFKDFSFLGFPDPHPTGDHICAPTPADQQSDHLHRPWIHSLRRVLYWKIIPKNQISQMGLNEWGKWAQTGSK